MNQENSNESFYLSEPPTCEELAADLGGKYEINCLHDRGGMGAVFDCHRIENNERIAIKVLLADQLSSSNSGFDFAQRFKREAEAMSRLDHPNIVRVDEFGETDKNTHFIAMEFVDGTNLQKLLDRNLPKRHIFKWMTQLCDALQYAHTKGMVHRDIKPANILINSKNDLKVADFGLVKVLNRDSMVSMHTNVAMGTLDYIAPEVFENPGQVDHRADIYAVGVIIYQMLTGRTPRGLWDPPSIVNPEVNERFNQVVAKALATNPDRRYQSMVQLSGDLRNIYSENQPTQRVEPGSIEPEGKRQSTQERAGGKAVSSVGKEPKIKMEMAIIASILLLLAIASIGFVKWGLSESKPKDKPISSPVITTKPPPPETIGEARINSLGMEFVAVPGLDVLFSKYETTVGNYTEFAEANPGTNKAWKSAADKFQQDSSHPVIYVNWEDAQKFCQWLSEKDAGTYRLPNDVEWQMAAGISDPAEKQNLFLWGETWPPPEEAKGNFSGTESDGLFKMADYTDPYKFTAPVGSFDYHRNGIKDLSGNIREWIQDQWPSPTTRNLRGGTWQSMKDDLNLLRPPYQDDLETRSSNIGFRCVLVE